MDIWGDIYLAEHEGRSACHVMERDDGREEIFNSATHYFKAPRADPERELLAMLRGPILDLGAGVGSYTLYLQEQGYDVTAADSSIGALKVCRERGCRKVLQLDLRDLRVEPSSFGAIIIMGNTLGAHQTPESLPRLFRSLRQALVRGGSLLFSTVDPLDTDDESHLAYHRRNRQRGEPPGLIRMRMKCGGLIDEWMTLYLPTDAELEEVATREGWALAEIRSYGPHRARLLRRAPEEVLDPQTMG